MTRGSRFESWKRDTYPAYWSKKSREYGLDSYCAGLLNIIKSFQPARVFELGIGNGFPFAENLAANGVSVAGCDVSGTLIEELRRNLPGVRAWVGGYEDDACVDPLLTGWFDAVFCLRSTWYFPDVEAAIDFMLRLAKPGGGCRFRYHERRFRLE